jgi:L-threonine kinase
VATRSALLNQRLHPKTRLDEMITVARTLDALGVVAAHSGTILGLMFADSDPHLAGKVDAARRACCDLVGHSWVDYSLATRLDSVSVGADRTS